MDRDIALLDQAIAETADDLRKLVDHATALLADHDWSTTVDQLVQGLLDQPSWARLELCSVLGLAVVRLAEAGN